MSNDEAEEIQLGGQGTPLECVQEERETALVEQEATKSGLAGAQHWVGKTHVKFNEKHGRDEEVLVAPEGVVVHQGDPARVIANVEREPNLLED